MVIVHSRSNSCCAGRSVDVLACWIPICKHSSFLRKRVLLLITVLHHSTFHSFPLSSTIQHWIRLMNLVFLITNRSMVRSSGIPHEATWIWLITTISPLLLDESSLDLLGLHPTFVSLSIVGLFWSVCSTWTWILIVSLIVRHLNSR
jgi:hypothetical protein